MDFAELIMQTRSALAQFDYDHYPASFDAFCAACAPLFDALDGTEDAAALVDALERARSGLGRRETRRAEEEQKQVLALFFTPAARRRGPEAAAFAEELRRQWCARHPRSGYLAGDYETIMKGFDANLLGLPLRKSKRR